MMDEMANHGNRVRRYMDRFGVEEVETFIDACLSIEDLIDIHSPFIKRRDEQASTTSTGARRRRRRAAPGRFQRQGLSWIRSSIRRQVLAAEAEQLRKKKEREQKNVPGRADARRDAVRAGARPAQAWQADVLSIIRDEAYYFAPQGQTKIMNEGWASYWHSHDHDPPGPRRRPT